ncbi:MAG: ferric reductase-like transmembrane domain-containing protein [Alphaproteobacteria bacterium]
MSVKYRPVQWNRNKYVYDAVLVIGIAVYVYLFMQVSPMLLEVRPIEAPVRRIRALGTCAFLMLTFILCIGPLARLDRRFLPLLYNRRHFGVMLFLVALTHFTHALAWYYSFSPIDPYVSLLSANTAYTSWSGFPFEIFGIAALLILFAMAATSHDFWLVFLTPPVWKTLHMGVYIAYGLIVLHVTFGLLQSEPHPFYAVMTGGSFFLVVALHIAAGMKEVAADADDVQAAGSHSGWVTVGPVTAIAMNRAKIVVLPDGERVAVFRYENKLSAISNVCAHQNGPLGEGRVIDGCITCPWHGFQYRPEDGCSPPPFTEKVPTYRLSLDGDTILLDPAALPPGTPVDPVVIPEGTA